MSLRSWLSSRVRCLVNPKQYSPSQPRLNRLSSNRQPSKPKLSNLQANQLASKRCKVWFKRRLAKQMSTKPLSNSILCNSSRAWRTTTLKLFRPFCCKTPSSQSVSKSDKRSKHTVVRSSNSYSSKCNNNSGKVRTPPIKEPLQVLLLTCPSSLFSKLKLTSPDTSKR